MSADTPTILAALDWALEKVAPFSDGHVPVLRALRSQIEKERPFLEAAMAYCAWNWTEPQRDSIARFPESPRGETARLLVAYRALISDSVKAAMEHPQEIIEIDEDGKVSLISEKPPEEGAK